MHTGFEKYITTITNPTSFKYHFIYNGSESRYLIVFLLISVNQVNHNLCNGNKVTSLTCETGIANLK